MLTATQQHALYLQMIEAQMNADEINHEIESRCAAYWASKTSTQRKVAALRTLGDLAHSARTFRAATTNYHHA